MNKQRKNLYKRINRFMKDTPLERGDLLPKFADFVEKEVKMHPKEFYQLQVPRKIVIDLTPPEVEKVRKALKSSWEV